MKLPSLAFLFVCLFLIASPAWAEGATGAPLGDQSDLCRSALFAMANYLMQEKQDPSTLEEIYFAGKEPASHLKTFLKNAESYCEATGQPMVNMATLAFVLVSP